MGRMNGKTAILSGRYVIVHPGHIATIRRFGQIYSKLYVYIVNDPGSPWPSQWSKQLIDYCTVDMSNVKTVLDFCHFGYATEEDLVRLPEYDDFLCGNSAVSEHLRSLGVHVVEFEPTPGYSSTQIKHNILKDAVEAWRMGQGK